MTDYIEEMMRTAGISSTEIPNYLSDGMYNYWRINGYPLFTPEKQLEIIKLMGKSRGFFCAKSQPDKWYVETKDNYIKHKDFTQALAQLTTELMKAGKLDKEKVKEILQ